LPEALRKKDEKSSETKTLLIANKMKCVKTKIIEQLKLIVNMKLIERLKDTEVYR
jgi:hypothetical protein